MNKQILFRNKGRGYNKDDVNSYIAQENKKFAQIDANYRRLLQEKEKVIQGFGDELFRKNNELAELQNQLIQKDAVIEEYKLTCEKNAETVSDLTNQIEMIKASGVNQISGIDFDSSEEELLYENPNLKYEQIQSQVDDILNHAKAQAIKIINAAIETSHQYEVTQNEIDSIKNDITERSNDIINELKSSIVHTEK